MTTDSNEQIAIEVLCARVRSKEEDLNSLKRHVNQMCLDAGQSIRYANISSSEGGDLASIRKDTFYGLAISGAAKKYLEMRKAANMGAASFSEIFAALKDGGYKFDAKDDENAKNGLRISLRKNSSIFHRLPEGNSYGLLAWYPNAKPPKDGDDADDELATKKKSPKAKKPKAQKGIVEPASTPAAKSNGTHPPTAADVTAHLKTKRGDRVKVIAAALKASVHDINAIINSHPDKFEVAERGWIKAR